jgi:trk system potassium uptake protein
VWHAVNLFVAAFDTGGFAPTSQSIGYYHSATVEVVSRADGRRARCRSRCTTSCGRRAELARNLEVRSLLVTTVVL